MTSCLQQTQLQTILADPEIQGASVSVCVADASGKLLFEHESDRRLNPASNQKLLSTLFFVDQCGWGPLPTTKFWREKNTITVQSSGDPSLSLEKLRAVAKKLGAPIPKIRLAQAYSPGFHPNWEYDDMPNRYGAGIASFVVDSGSFTFKIIKGSIQPLLRESQIKIVREASDGPLKVKYDLFKSILYVRGKINPDTNYSENFAFLDPDRVAARMLGKQIIDVPFDSVPATPPSAEIAADATEDMLRHCLVESDNTFAENFLLLGAAKNQKLEAKSPWGLACQRLTTWLSTTAQWRGPEPMIDDGSGLSRHTGITTHGIVSLLAWARNQSWFDRYAACLPSPGAGTMKGRIQGSSFRGKTGTLSGVVALSGYLTEKSSGRPLIFSVIVNQSSRNTQFTRSIVDKLAVALENGALHDSVPGNSLIEQVCAKGLPDPRDSVAYGNRSDRSHFDRTLASLRTHR